MSRLKKDHRRERHTANTADGRPVQQPEQASSTVADGQKERRSERLNRPSQISQLN